MSLRVSLECKYDLEESTVENLSVTKNDDNNPSGQSTVEEYKEGEEPEPDLSQHQKRGKKRLQT
jgi:hypothetical protein